MTIHHEERCCAGCGAPLVMGQRRYGPHPETEKRFARRSYCSVICQMKAAKQRRRARRKMKRLELSRLR